MKKVTKFFGYTFGMLLIVASLILFLIYAGIWQDLFHVHKYGEWDVILEPGCFDGGERQRICECGHVEHEFTESLGHEGLGFVIPESLKSTHSSNKATAKKSTWFSILVAKPHAP